MGVAHTYLRAQHDLVQAKEACFALSLLVLFTSIQVVTCHSEKAENWTQPYFSSLYKVIPSLASLHVFLSCQATSACPVDVGERWGWEVSVIASSSLALACHQHIRGFIRGRSSRWLTGCVSVLLYIPGSDSVCARWILCVMQVRWGIFQGWIHLGLAVSVGSPPHGSQSASLTCWDEFSARHSVPGEVCWLPGLGMDHKGGSSLKWWGPKTCVLLASLYGCTHDTERQMSQCTSPRVEHLHCRSCGLLHTRALK